MKAPYLVNSLWSLACLPEAKAFRRDLHRVERTQRAYLKALLSRNRDSAYGRYYGFRAITGPEEFQSRVPLVDYADLEPSIRSAALGQPALTVDPVRLLEPTGGTQGGSKFIPYTRALQNEFRRGLAPWIRNLFETFPRLAAGTAYWSITPPLAQRPPFPCVLPVGFEQDSDYLGALGRWLERHAFAVPAASLRGLAPEAFLDRVAASLLADERLALVSIWNPGLFLLLLDRLRARREPLLREVHDGGDPARARAAAAALDRPGEEGWRELWPNLQVISCWRDGWARLPAERLQARFPGVYLQPKGLLATEALVTWPCESGGTAVVSQVSGAKHLLAYRSHFFEFTDVESGKTRLPWEIRAGGAYSVVVTTGGGLYRYRLRDIVRIEGFRASCPVVRFVEKEDSLSDLTGEKLHTDFVEQCAGQVLKEAGMPGSFYIVAPEPEATPPRYRLHFSAPGSAPEDADGLGRRLDQALQGNFQYRVSRELGQLGPVAVSLLPEGAEAGYYYYKNRRAKLGDIKWKPLEASGPWTEILQARPA